MTTNYPFTGLLCWARGKMSGEAKFGETKNSIRNCAETEAELVIFRDLAHSE